jgi:orotate phosphoribosyltransferase
MLRLLKAGAMTIRNVDNGEEPFLYSSGNHGPGYVNIKGKVGQKSVIVPLTCQLAVKLATKFPDLDFIAGNVTGGLVPGWILSERLEQLLGKEVPFVYIRNARKKGGLKELVTGIDNNPDIRPGSNGVVVEELVNFAETTCNGAASLRAAGFAVTHAACILFYGNPLAIRALREARLEMVHHFTLPELLEIAQQHGTHPANLIAIYREYLDDPLGWQRRRGLASDQEGGMK